MGIDPEAVERTFAFDRGRVAGLRARWARLMELAVWGELKAAKVGAVPRLRKRLLELGEDLRSVVSDRRWIPRPRERVKGALGASLKLRDTLLGLERAAKLVEGGADFERFEHELLDFRRRLLELVEPHESMWGELLESQYAGEDGDEAGEG
ncbi:MAG: hypothetical protein GWO02_16450 [Gammaproteobacteria bacterium]|nr:hypothetical protein [Gammaproteobacteria bacterium]